jgi:5'-nucleotidase
MAAVFEAAIDKVPAIGFSLNDYSYAADLSHTEKYIENIARNVLENGLPEGVCLNVNIPANSDKAIKGVKVCRQSMGSWVEEFDERVDPRGRDYYWITGVFSNPDHVAGTDTMAMEENYVSVVPMKFDFTDYEAMKAIEMFDFSVESRQKKQDKEL